MTTYPHPLTEVTLGLAGAHEASRIAQEVAASHAGKLGPYESNEIGLILDAIQRLSLAATHLGTALAVHLETPAPPAGEARRRLPAQPFRPAP